MPERPDVDLQPPTLREVAEADQAADRNVVRAAVLKVTYLMEPDMQSDRFDALIQYIADRGWTGAEVRHAAERLPVDKELDEKLRYGGRLTPADFQRHVEHVRSATDEIKQPMDPEQRDYVLAMEPGLTPADFERTRRPQHDGPDPWLLTEEALQRVFGLDRSRTAAPTSHE